MHRREFAFHHQRSHKTSGERHGHFYDGAPQRTAFYSTGGEKSDSWRLVFSRIRFTGKIVSEERHFRLKALMCDAGGGGMFSSRNNGRPAILIANGGENGVKAEIT